MDANCEVYFAQFDQCQTCLTGYFMNVERECQKNPSGIQDCSDYESEERCRNCHTNFYPSADRGACLPVDKEAEVPNCRFYDAN